MALSTTVPAFFPSAAQFPGAGIVHARTGSIPAPFCMTLVDLTELEQLMEQKDAAHELWILLSPEENKLFSSFTYPKRKREWLGGRIAAKYAVLQLLQITPEPETIPVVSILPAADGSPHIAAPLPIPGEPPALSISHSDRYAVGIAAQTKACGIDIQKITEKTVRVANRFCEEKELQLLQDRVPLLSLTERLTLLWSAKEALKKAMLNDQPVIFHGVVLESLEWAGNYSLCLHYPGDQGCPAVVSAIRLGDCFLSHILVTPVHA